jgi:hypothetical protein
MTGRPLPRVLLAVLGCSAPVALALLVTYPPMREPEPDWPEPWPEVGVRTTAAVPDGSGDEVAIGQDGALVSRSTRAGQVRWTAALGGGSWLSTAGLYVLPDGGLVAYRFCAAADSGVDVVRFDPTTGSQVWGAHVAGRRVAHSEYGQQVEVVADGGRLRVSVWGSGTFAGRGKVVEDLAADDGRSVHRQQWGPRLED